jgi:autophagy-related protein 17
VLSRDASQVPDVVHELRERLDEMEHIFLQISRNMNELRSLEHDTITLFAAFEQFQVELAGCIDGLAVFEQKQADLKVDMESRLEELWRLGEFTTALSVRTML